MGNGGPSAPILSTNKLVMRFGGLTAVGDLDPCAIADERELAEVNG